MTRARQAFREEFRAWARDRALPVDTIRTEFYQSDPFDESGKDWGFHYSPRLVKMAVALWENSDFARIPTPEEIAELDPRWLVDLNQGLRIARFWKQRLETDE